MSADRDRFVGRLRELAAAPAAAAALHAILDRRERTGRLPASLTVPADPPTAAALAALLSARAVSPRGAGRVTLRLDVAARALAASGLALDELLYLALSRAPRDPGAEEIALRAEAAAAVRAATPPAASPAAKEYLAAAAAEIAAGRGDLLARARDHGPAAAGAEAALLACLLDGAIGNRAPVRLATFAARVAGDSKALTRDRRRSLGRALLDHHDVTRADVLGDPRADDPASWARIALEARGVYRDEAALVAYCFGPLTYNKGGERFDQVARHAARGEVSALTLPQLRGAKAGDLAGARVLVVENQTPFLELVDALAAGARHADIAVLARGQAGWAVVLLLRMLADAGARIGFSGDLDRSGVLILRSLAQRTSARIAPVAMDAALHARVSDRGRPIAAAERERLEALLAADDPRAAGHDLLCALAASSRWIEQETFFADAVLDPPHHDKPPF